MGIWTYYVDDSLEINFDGYISYKNVVTWEASESDSNTNQLVFDMYSFPYHELNLHLVDEDEEQSNCE